MLSTFATAFCITAGYKTVKNTVGFQETIDENSSVLRRLQMTLATAPTHKGWPGWVGLSGLDKYQGDRPAKDHESLYQRSST